LETGAGSPDLPTLAEGEVVGLDAW
jgi:hypothetical protein